MKSKMFWLDYKLPISLTVLSTFLAISYAIIQSIENPPYIGEEFAVNLTVVLNALWLLPYNFYFQHKSPKTLAISILFVLCAFSLLLLIIQSTHRPFDSHKWKSELDSSRTYAGYPRHRNGDMVRNIINDRILIGLSAKEVENMLGSVCERKKGQHGEEYLFFPYSSSKAFSFDGCDKLLITMQDEVCIKAGYSGCD